MRWLLVFVTVALGCASAPPKPLPPSPPPAFAPAEPLGSELPDAGAAAPAKPPRPLEIRSECHEPVSVFYGKTPGGPGTRAVIEGEATVSATRDADGTLTVWITDEKGDGLASVQVSRRMRRVDIGGSCRTLYAH